MRSWPRDIARTSADARGGLKPDRRALAGDGAFSTLLAMQAHRAETTFAEDGVITSRE
jgi:hypothetical protein